MVHHLEALMRKLEQILKVFLTLFGAYLLYQIIKKMMGGSWSVEELILGLIIFNIGATFTIGMMIVQVKAGLKHLTRQFSSLAQDFKSHMKDTR
jgi:hypothetical protein